MRNELSFPPTSYLFLGNFKLQRGITLETFNLIAGGASILSLLISLFIAQQVITIKNNIRVNSDNTKQDQSGQNNMQVGRDHHGDQ